jgi:hypothetical protein
MKLVTSAICSGISNGIANGVGHLVYKDVVRNVGKAKKKISEMNGKVYSAFENNNNQDSIASPRLTKVHRAKRVVKKLTKFFSRVAKKITRTI